jgi:IS1 family transposase
VNHGVLASLNPEQVEVEIWRADELEVRRGLSSELDEMWSYVFKKANPRWLWHAMDHHTGKVLAYVFGRRQEIYRSYYDSRKSLYLVVACGNHQCIGFVKARTVVSMSARQSFRRYHMSKPANSPPRRCPSAPPKPRALRRRRCLSSGRRSLWRRGGV